MTSSLRSLQKRLWTLLTVGGRCLDDKFVGTCVKIIQRYGYDQLSKGALNKYGWTALHAACYHGRVEAVKYLVDTCKVELK